jgi:hypothetical protein
LGGKEEAVRGEDEAEAEEEDLEGEEGEGEGEGDEEPETDAAAVAADMAREEYTGTVHRCSFDSANLKMRKHKIRLERFTIALAIPNQLCPATSS